MENGGENAQRKKSQLPSSHRQSRRPSGLFICHPGPPVYPFFTFLAGQKRIVSHLFPAISFKFPFHLHFISARFAYNVSRIQHSFSHLCCPFSLSLSLSSFESEGEIPHRSLKRYISPPDPEIFYFPTSSVISLSFSRGFQLWISSFLGFFFQCDLSFSVHMSGRSVVDRF